MENVLRDNKKIRFFCKIQKKSELNAKINVMDKNQYQK